LSKLQFAKAGTFLSRHNVDCLYNDLVFIPPALLNSSNYGYSQNLENMLSHTQDHNLRI